MECGEWQKNQKRRSHLRRLSLHSQNPVSTHTLKTKPRSYSGPFSANEAAMLCNASPELSLLQPACFGLSASSSILFPGLSLAWRCSGLNSGSRFMVILSFLVPRGCSVLGFQILHRMMSDGSSFCCPLEKFVSPKLTTDFEAGEGWCLSDCRTPSIFQQNYLVYLVDEVSASPHPCGRPSGWGSSQLYPTLTPPPLQLFSEPLWLSTALPSSLSWIESLLRLYWLFFLILGGGFSSTVLFNNVCFLVFILLIIH